MREVKITAFDVANLAGREDAQAHTAPAAPALKKEDAASIDLPQMIGLALGIAPKEMRMDHHVVSTKKLLSKLQQPTMAT